MRITALMFLVGCQAAPGGGVLTGHVLLEGADDHGGVVVTLSGPRSAVTESAADGSYRFEGVSPGTWLVSAAADSTREGVLSTLSDGVTVPDLVFHPVGTLEGRVTRAGGAAGNAGIVVLATGSSSLATTDESGGFTLGGLAPGRYELHAFTSGFLPGIARDLTVERGRRTPVPEVDLQPAQTGGPQPGELRGQVKLTGLDDASGITVTLEGPGSLTTTGTDGHFVLPNPPDGIYSLAFDQGDYHEEAPGVLAIPDATGFYLDGALYPMVDSTLTLPRGRRQLSGVILDARLSPHRDLLFVRRSDGGTLYSPNGTLLTLPAAGGAPTTVATRVANYQFSPDGNSVSWMVGPDGNYTYDLYTAPVSGGPPLKLAGGVTLSFSYTPDGAHLLIGGAAYTSELWTVPSAGGAPRKLAQMSRGPIVLPDSQQVLVLANCQQQYYSLYPCDLQRVPLDGTPPTTLASGVLDYLPSPQRDRVQYSDAGGQHIVDVAGGTVTNLFAGLTGYLGAFTPDGSQVVAALATMPKGQTDLYVSSIAGGTPTKLADNINGYQLSPAGTMVYINPYPSSDIRAVPVAGGPVQTLGTTSWFGGPFTFSPSGAWVVVRSDYAAGAETVTLGIMPAEGGTLRTLATQVLINSVRFSADDAQIAFIVDDGHFGAQGSLQVAPTAGGAAVTLAGQASDVEGFSPSGATVLYHLNDQPRTGTLAVVPVAGGTPKALFGLSQAAFFEGDDTVVGLRRLSPAPFHFQNGLYLLRAD
jgi:hypothetical protein